MIVMHGTRNTIWLWAEQEGAITQRNGRYGVANGGGGDWRGLYSNGEEWTAVGVINKYNVK